MVKDRAAQRAQEEYNKAAIAYRQGNSRAAAFHLGAMAHYIGDVSQYGHSVPNETHHSDYERSTNWPTCCIRFPGTSCPRRSR
jgi:hypothetical protein